MENRRLGEEVNTIRAQHPQLSRQAWSLKFSLKMNEHVLFSTLPFQEATRQNEATNPLCFEMRQSTILSLRSTSEVFQAGFFGIFKTAINKRKPEWTVAGSSNIPYPLPRAQKAESRPLNDDQPTGNWSFNGCLVILLESFPTLDTESEPL